MTKTHQFGQILVVGAGSVGGFFGASLARHHPNVSFLLRPKTLEAVRQGGLTVRSGSRSFTVHPRAEADPLMLPHPDLIILGVKAYDLRETLEQLSKVIDQRAVILTLQNGVSIEDTILTRFPQCHVVGGVAFIYSKIARPGVIDHFKKGTMTIGELSGEETPELLGISELFHSSGVECTVSKNIRRAKWGKMCWNCVFNPLTVVLDDHVARVLDHPPMQQVIAAIVREVVAIAACEGVVLPEGMPERVAEWSQELRDIHTSMYDDWRGGRETEIDYLNGYIVDQGAAHHIPTPVNLTLWALVKALTAGNDDKKHTAQVSVVGDVLKESSFHVESLQTFPSDHQVSNVPGLAPGIAVRGIRVKALLEVVTPRIGADHVTFHSGDGKFSASVSLADAQEYGILLYEMNSRPIPAEKGGPFRLLAPGLGDLCANVKNVRRIELTRGPGQDTRPSLRVC